MSCIYQLQSHSPGSVLLSSSLSGVQQASLESLSKLPGYIEAIETDYHEKEALSVHLSNSSTLQMIQEEQNEMTMVSSTSSSLSSSASTTPRMSITSSNNRPSFVIFDHEVDPMLAILKRGGGNLLINPVKISHQNFAFKSSSQENSFEDETAFNGEKVELQK